jgi:hypothetical protein
MQVSPAVLKTMLTLNRLKNMGMQNVKVDGAE